MQAHKPRITGFYPYIGIKFQKGYSQLVHYFIIYILGKYM